MAEEGSGSNESIPVIHDTDADSARAYYEQQLAEHARLKKIVNFFRKKDDLDENVYQVVEYILSMEPKLGETPFEMQDVADMIDSFCHLDQVLTPQFFHRTPFPFRMLRLCLDLHLVDPIDESKYSSVRMTADETRNQGLKQLIWFLFLLRATPEQVNNNLIMYRQSKSDARASFTPVMTNAPSPVDARDPASSLQPPQGVQDVRRNFPAGAYAPQNLSPTGSVARATASTRNDDGYFHSKKGSAVDLYFKDRRFSGAPEKSVNNLIRDYEICAAQQCLDQRQMSLFFVNALTDPARQFFLTHCSASMPFDQIVSHMRRHYNSETKKLQLQSEMDSLDITIFMQKRQISDHAEGLTKLVDHINALAPQLPDGFGDDSHKTRYLRRAVMRLGFAQQPISQLTTARYTFTQFITALHESLQLMEEISRARATELNYGQYVHNPRDVRPSGSRWSHARDRSPYHQRNRSRSPFDRRHRDLSPGPSGYKKFQKFRNNDDRRVNPNVRDKKVCWGCGSPDHILSDRKCTPKLDTIKTNITDCVENDESAIDKLAEQFVTLHARASQESRTEVPDRSDLSAQHVRFEESLYTVEENDTIESRFEAGFRNEPYDVQFVSFPRDTQDVYDCSHIKPLGLTFDKPPGFCVDIGAPKSVVGHAQLKIILKHIGRKNIPRIRSRNSFRFGDVTVHSLGLIEIALRTPSTVPDIAVLMDIVPVNVPALLGLDVLDSEQLYADNVTNRLVHRFVTSSHKGNLRFEDRWHVSLIRHDSHLYAAMSFPHYLFYTTAQLEKMHRQFAHPSASKLFNLLKRAGTEAVDAKTYKRISDIVSRCEPCQRIHNAPVRFRVSIGHENVRFNARVYIDIMYLDGKPVLHIVDEATRFSAARFLPKVSTDSVWESIILCWSSVYTGLPHYIMVDEGSQFRRIFAELSALHDVTLEKSGVQSHHSLGVGERYHKPLRDTYRKLKLDHPSMQRQVLLALAVKAMNDTLGPEGIVPSSLVFGEFPSLRTFVGPVIPRPSLAERAEAAQEARRLMAKHLAQTRVQRALKHNTPTATNRVYQPGEEVLVWREKIVENRIGEWVGPYTVKSFDEKSRIVLVQKDEDSPHERYNITQVKPFQRPEEAATSFLDIVHGTLSDFSPENRPFDTRMTEVIDSNDPRARTPEMRDAITSEVRDLLRRGTFKVILKEELPDGANALTARFVLAIKSNADGQIKYKARYVIGGHRDRLKQYLVHGAQTLQASSARLLLALAAMYDFDVWSSDVKLAYLQSSEPLLRRVFIKNPAPEFELQPTECFELLRPLYGLSDAGDLWHQTLHDHLVNDLKLVSTKADPSLYYAFENRELVGLSGSYVDDLLRAGRPSFREACTKTHERFETSGDETPPFTFAGFNIAERSDVPFAIDQIFYMKKLEQLDHSSSFAEFRSMRMRLAWLANTRPDLQFEISQLAQVTAQRFEDDARAHLKRLNATIRYAHDNVAHLKFPKLDRSSLRIVGYSDAAFANNFDLTSQLGRIILLMDDTNAAIPVIFKSYKSRRVTRSVLSAEVIAFADLFDDAYALRSQIEQTNGRAVPMHLMTDSKSLFDIISKGSRTSEKRVMLDIHSARQAYRAHQISNIGFVRSCDNLADGLTKPKMQKVLFELLKTGTHKVKCEQWILRNEVRK